MGLTFEGTSLVEFVDQTAVSTVRAGRRMAEDLGSRFKHNIEINTPVRTAHLRESYKISPILYHADLAAAAYIWTGEVFTEVEYANYVERGTGLWGPEHKKYMIKPKLPGGVLAFSPYMKHAGGVILDIAGSPSKSGTVVVRYVMHPGSPGAAMFRIGAVVTEHEADEWSHQALRQWERDSEQEGVLTVDADVQWAEGFA